MNNFFKLMETAIKTGSNGYLALQMGVAAIETIAVRTRMINEAFLEPHKMSDPEFQRMVFEKVDAYSRSGVHMNAVVQKNWLKSERWLTDQIKLSTSMTVQLSRCDTTPGAAIIWMEWVARSSQLNINFLTDQALNLARAGEAGIKPVHKKATGNAHRLRKK